MEGETEGQEARRQGTAGERAGQGRMKGRGEYRPEEEARQGRAR